MRIAPLEQNVRLGAHHKECLAERQHKQPLEINVTTVHHVERARLGDDLIEHVHVVYLAVGDVNERRLHRGHTASARSQSTSARSRRRCASRALRSICTLIGSTPKKASSCPLRCSCRRPFPRSPPLGSLTRELLPSQGGAT